MSMILVMLRSSMNLGLRDVVSDEPHPKHEPQPHANTWMDRNNDSDYNDLNRCEAPMTQNSLASPVLLR